MKKLMILFALVLGSTLTYAQRGYNSGATHHNGYNQGGVHYNNGNRGNNGWRGNNNGWNRTNRTTRTTTRHYRGGGQGMNYRGGVTTYNNRPQTRVRWRTSNCGTYRVRMTQERRWNNGYWAYTNGCRRWVEPCYTWHTVCRERVYRNACGW